MNEQQIRRLVMWNRVWLGLFVMLSVVFFGISWLNRYLDNEVRALSIYWTEEGGIRLRSSSDGPFVVTHLSKVARSEPEKSVARLSPPIVIVDSAGARLSKSELDKLKWYGYQGDPHPSPAMGAEIVAFYYRPKATKPSTPQ